jgi:hypothetical protein
VAGMRSNKCLSYGTIQFGCVYGSNFLLPFFSLFLQLLDWFYWWCYVGI